MTIKADDPRYKGLKISLMAFLSTILGFVIYIVGYKEVGYAWIIFSMITVFIGIIIHIKLFFIDKQPAHRQKYD